MSLKKTDKQFKKEVHNLFRDEYLHNKKKIKVRHNKCEYDTIPTNFLNKHGCPKCRLKKEALKTEKEILD